MSEICLIQDMHNFLIEIIDTLITTFSSRDLCLPNII